MANRDYIKSSLFLTDASVWLCSNCTTGWLVPQRQTFTIEDAGGPRSSWLHGHWEPSWNVRRFSCQLACDNLECGALTIVHGDTRAESTLDQDSGVYRSRLYPTRVLPPSSLFALPPALPTEIGIELRRAFGLFWSDAPACANAIRSVVEMVLSERGIKRSSHREGKFARLPLHDRIDLFEKRYPELADAMTSVRWLGDTGSQPGQLSPSSEDLVAGIELLEDMLVEIYADVSVAARGPLLYRRHVLPPTPRVSRHGLEMRTRVVQAYYNGDGTVRQLAQRFAMSPGTVQRYLTLHRANGAVPPQHDGGAPRTLDEADLQRLRALHDEMPGATEDELASAFSRRYCVALSRSMVRNALKRLEIL